MVVPGSLYAKAIRADAPSTQNVAYSWLFRHPRFEQADLAAWTESLQKAFRWDVSEPAGKCVLIVRELVQGGKLLVRVQHLPCDVKGRGHRRYEFFLFDDGTSVDPLLGGAFKSTADAETATFDVGLEPEGAPLQCSEDRFAGCPIQIYCQPGLCHLAQERAENAQVEFPHASPCPEREQLKEKRLGVMGRVFLVVFAIAAVVFGTMSFRSWSELGQVQNDHRDLQERFERVKVSLEENERVLRQRAQWETQRQNFERNVNDLRTKIEHVQDELKAVNLILKDIGVRRDSPMAPLKVLTSTNRLDSVRSKYDVKVLPPTRVERSQPLTGDSMKRGGRGDHESGTSSQTNQVPTSWIPESVKKLNPFR